jgi:hypothetical protein
MDTPVKSICLKEEPRTNIYEDKEIYEYIRIDQLMNYDNCFIIYSSKTTEDEFEHNDSITTEYGNKTHFNCELDEIIELYGFIPMTGFKNKRSDYLHSFHT